MLALLVIAANSGYSQSRRNSAKKADWQISTAPDGLGATLGIRDKYGERGSFNTLFVVTAPDKKTFKVRRKGVRDEWVYVNFPEEFGGNPSAGGNYTVRFYANGRLVGQSKFSY